MYSKGLVLEGGGMRGIFTAGVLDFFLENNIEFNDCFAVSAGACHACSYLSKQHKRAYDVSIDYIKDKNYCSIYSLLSTGNLFGVKMVYDKIPNEMNLYDYEEYLKSKTRFFVVATNCNTGNAEYKLIEDMRSDMDIIRASSSLPLLSRIVCIKGEEYLDGGISDSIPIKESVKRGNLMNVVVLTQHRGYRKQPNRLMALFKIKYRNYPKLINSLENRYIVYNQTLDYIYEEEKKGNLFIIQPQEPLCLGRVEKNKEKLSEVYQKGYLQSKDNFEGLKSFLDS